MKVVVLAGSPKGNASVTLQSVRWLERRHPEHRFVYHRVAQRIKRLVNDPAAVEEILDDVRGADLVIWAFPVFYFLVHAHLKRFIELVLAEHRGAFTTTYAIGFSTSIHVMDHTAHAYVRAVSDDLGMRWLGSYSAHMRDLLDERERRRLESFFEQVLEDVERGAPGEAPTPRLPEASFVYEPGIRAPTRRLELDGKRLLVVTDMAWGDSSLRHMVRRFRTAFQPPIRVVNLRDVDIASSCLGCIRCAYDNTCVFEGVDGFIPFFRERVEQADILVIAGTVRDRWLSFWWKTFLDRQFFENHRPVLEGVEIGVLVSGPAGGVPHLYETIAAYAEAQHAELVGWVCDEEGDSLVLDRRIDDLARRLVRAAGREYRSPMTFRGEGTHRIFRDSVYTWMRFPFVADHRSYRENGYYDFAHKDRRSRVTNTVLASLARIPRIRTQMYGQLKEQIVRPYRAVVDLERPPDRD
jgi:multimeric flavodoxin WrbA